MSTTAVSGVSNNSTITLNDFMQVLMTQLTYQDPLKPMDNQEFLAQIAQFTALEQTQQMNTNIQTLVSNQAAQQSIGLIGKTVNISTSSGPMSGTVKQIDLSSSSPTLTLSTTSGTVSGISISQITSVQ
ncbi:flagellar hook assembly protein FlgD [Holophaga foetida]|uniref:flagellar hook assembly protein FlgD n=1 Tax=Holophaga foetida TaxID=35839 RepID=UPI0002474653|nr:flagellar hook capping FlgD N-terminal domain-containing protein [Holophaga foetida]